MKYLRYLLISFVVACSACAINPQVKIDETLEKAREEYKQKKYQETAITLMPLVREGNPDAQYTLGYLYFYGMGVPRNVNFGRQLIQAAAEQGNIRALAAINTFAQQTATLGPSLDQPSAPGNELLVSPDDIGAPSFF